MGEGTPHIAGSRVVALAAEASAARERLDVLVAELRRRRDDLMDWRTQLRRHRRGLTIVLGGVVAMTAAGLAVQIARNRRHAGLAARVAELTDKAERLGRALGRVAEDPDRLAPVARSKTRWAAIPAALSVALPVALPVVRMLLPHLAAALAPPSRRPLN
jgi:hypothetical protein